MIDLISFSLLALSINHFSRALIINDILSVRNGKYVKSKRRTNVKKKKKEGKKPKETNKILARYFCESHLRP